MKNKILYRKILISFYKKFQKYLNNIDKKNISFLLIY